MEYQAWVTRAERGQKECVTFVPEYNTCCMNVSLEGIPSRKRDLFRRNLTTFFGNSRARAVGLVFASDSLLLGSWVAHIPYIKDKLQLTDTQLGMTLFAMPVGLLVMNPLTGWIVGRLGQARACLLSALVLCLAMLVPVNAPNVTILAAGLFVTGLAGALINVAMNTCATDVEKADNISIMASCHGMWSLGGMIGSGLAGLALALHITPQAHMAAMAVGILLLTLVLRPILNRIPTVPAESTTSFIRPNLALLLMIVIGLAVAMGEGVALDWSSVYLRDVAGAPRQVAALGFGCFSLTMTLGRFLGDALIPRYGGQRLLRLGGLVAAAGLVLAMLVPVPAIVLLGFMLLGAGSSLGAPILYAASMRVPGIPPAAGLATFATFSFIGFLAGPPLIGFVAGAWGLTWGFALVATLLLLSALLTRLGWFKV